MAQKGNMHLATESEQEGVYLSAQETGRIIMGEEVKQLPDNKKLEVCYQVSQQLQKYTSTMLQYSPENLMAAISQGRAIVCLKDQDMDLLAFGQIWHYGQNLDGQDVYEFGSWLSFTKGGYGKQVLEAAQQLHSQMYPATQLIAIVEYYNLRAQAIIKGSGGILLGYKFSENIKTQGWVPAFMRIYDIARKEKI